MVDTSWLRHQVGAARQDNAHLNQSIRGNIAVAGSGKCRSDEWSKRSRSRRSRFKLELTEEYPSVRLGIGRWNF